MKLYNHDRVENYTVTSQIIRELKPVKLDYVHHQVIDNVLDHYIIHKRNVKPNSKKLFLHRLSAPIFFVCYIAQTMPYKTGVYDVQADRSAVAEWSFTTDHRSETFQ